MTLEMRKQRGSSYQFQRENIELVFLFAGWFGVGGNPNPRATKFWTWTNAASSWNSFAQMTEANELLFALNLQIQQEFGSFSNYCWRFVNQKPLRNGFRYGRQVPAKTPKAELISKDLMQRGFRCVGPTVVYSFMQVAGIANDHLISCFRYQECNADVEKDFKPPKSQEIEIVTKALGNTCFSHN